MKSPVPSASAESSQQMQLIRRMSNLLRPGRRAAGTLVLVVLLVLTTCAAGELTAQASPRHPSRATIIKVQRLFHELGYPLGTKPLGGLGVRTRGALSYFQRKYGLPVTGYPDARTIAEMQSVAASLRGSSAVAQAPPHDLVERVLGDDLPILMIAIALAAVLCLLALSAKQRSPQDSAAAEETIAVASPDN
jgi:hypothetical protein